MLGIDKIIQSLRSSQRADQTDNSLPLLRKAGEYGPILAQPQETSKPAHAGKPGVAGKRLVYVAISAIALFAVLVVWLTLRTPAGATDALAAGGPDAQEAITLNLRPTFTPTPTPGVRADEALAGDTAPIQIVVVTPTPDPSRHLAVGGIIIDRPLAVAGSELFEQVPGLLFASTGGSGAGQTPILVSTFDLSSIVVPPMIEEIVDAPLIQIEVIPIPGLEPKGTPLPTFTPAPTATPFPELLSPARKWSTFEPLSPEQNDHFWVGPAFLTDDYNQVAAPSYQFGSTAGGQYRPHHGIDTANPSGTQVRSGVVGIVVHAGPDDPVLLGPYNNFYGNTVVIKLDQKLSVGGGELDVFVLYGHLSQVSVVPGQRVNPEDVVGAVGMTGIAIGPHLHTEMRLGVNDYLHSVNPYLWLRPLPGNGAVAVRLLTEDGRSWPGTRLTLARFENGRAVWGRIIETYLDNENIGPNPAWGENGALGDVPAGYYVLVGNVNGEPVRAEFFVREGQTTFVELRTKQ